MMINHYIYNCPEWSMIIRLFNGNRHDDRCESYWLYQLLSAGRRWSSMMIRSHNRRLSNAYNFLTNNPLSLLRGDPFFDRSSSTAVDGSKFYHPYASLWDWWWSFMKSKYAWWVQAVLKYFNATRLMVIDRLKRYSHGSPCGRSLMSDRSIIQYSRMHVA